MNLLARKPWTQEQFLAWAERQDGRFEFDGFQPVAMTGGNAGHSRIITNIHAALRARLRGTPCDYYGPDLGVQTIGFAVRYPDALVTCTKFPRTDKLAPNVIAVFEVLSPSTSRSDRIDKVREYAAVPSIRSYIIVESDTAGLTVLHRMDGTADWTIRTLTGDETLNLPDIGIEIPVAEFYQDIEFETDTPGEMRG